MKKSNTDIKLIEEVILIGGSTLIPKINEIITKNDNINTNQNQNNNCIEKEKTKINNDVENRLTTKKSKIIF